MNQLIATALWAFLFLVVTFAPLRWSFVALLCISTIDYAGGRNSFAIGNVLKGLGLPAILLWRTRQWSGHRYVVLAPGAWLAFVGYIGIAGFWSLFPMSAVKLVLQMLGTYATAISFIRGTKAGAVSGRTAVYAAVGSLLLGVLATYILHTGIDEGRFTSFMSAQGYASLLAGLYCIILCSRGINTSTRFALCSLLVLAIIKDGSRTWFLGVLLSTTLYLVLSRGRIPIKICAGCFGIAVITIMIAGEDTFLGFIAHTAAGNRIAAAVTAAMTGDTSSVGLGTFNFRRQIGEIAIADIERSQPSELFFGRGTCNGAIITGSLFRGYAQMFDPNRMLHDEWLRVLYEWGIVGSALWLVFVGSLVIFALNGFRTDRTGDAKALLIYMPSFFVALSTENMLAGSVNAVSMSFVLGVALASVPHREYNRSRLAAADKWQLRRADPVWNSQI
jgi:hypothetical protein